ncbi:flagellar export chaperone FliS [Candidatus Sumerlaeota bacterium]|nr:flagellar export chaperone FliS [Candidatus Sumerlaeota bacterium]
MTGYQTYHRTSVQTADRVYVVVLLYEKAISNLNQATMHLDGELDECDWSKRMSNTQDILNYLHSALDFKQGGEIAANLAKLYDYIRDIVNDGTIHRDAEKLREARGLLAELLEGWRGIAKDNPGATAAENAAGASQRYGSMNGRSQSMAMMA